MREMFNSISDESKDILYSSFLKTNKELDAFLDKDFF